MLVIQQQYKTILEFLNEYPPDVPTAILLLGLTRKTVLCNKITPQPLFSPSSYWYPVSPASYPGLNDLNCLGKNRLLEMLLSFSFFSPRKVHE